MIEFFAEVGSNHNGSLERAKAIIYYAKTLGFDGIKFQYFKADRLWAESMIDEREAARKNELPLEWLPELSEYAKTKGLLFGLSVFDIDGLEEVWFYCDYLKIASFEAGYLDLVREVYKRNLRTMISLGQINKMELLEIFKNLPAQENRVDLLHCVSKYPTLIDELNLGVISSSKVINGYSDHSVRPAAIYGAVALGASVIEMHLDLQGGSGVEIEHSWEDSKSITETISIAKEIEKSIGNPDWNKFARKQDRKYRANIVTGGRGQ